MQRLRDHYIEPDEAEECFFHFTIDARGLGVMLELREQTRAKGIDFKLMNVSKLVSRMLEITGLDSVFKVTSGAEILSTRSLGRPASLRQVASCA